MHFSSWLSIAFALSPFRAGYLALSLLQFSPRVTLIEFISPPTIPPVENTIPPVSTCTRQFSFLPLFLLLPSRQGSRNVPFQNRGEASVLPTHQPPVLSNSNRHSKSKHNAILRSKHFYFSTCKPFAIPRGSLLFNCADHFATHSAPPFIPLFHVAHA